MNFFNIFKKSEEPHIKFVDTNGQLCNNTPIRRAKDVPTSFKEIQEEKFGGDYRFRLCPGLNDFSRFGYIISAPYDIHIKANRAGSFVYTAKPPRAPSEITKTGVKPVQNMDHNIPHGMFKYEDGIEERVWALFIDWRVIAKDSSLSAIVQAPYFHGNQEMLENLYIYPGVVDYGKGFPTISFIFSIRKKCEFFIKMGDPILHFIPTMQPSITNATYGIATEKEKQSTTYLKESNLIGFYRKNYTLTKIFKLKKYE